MNRILVAAAVATLASAGNAGAMTYSSMTSLAMTPSLATYQGRHRL